MDTCMYGDILCNLNRERNPLTSMLVTGGMCADRNNVSYAQRLDTSLKDVCMHARMHACMQSDVWAWQSKEVSTTCVPALCLLQHRMIGRVGVYSFAF